VAYGLVNRRVAKAEAKARVAELLQLVGLPGCEAKYPAQLSGGQQQRIALARALATAPSLLLLDEPLSALDAIVRVKLRQEIRSLQRQLGVTTIMVTHDQEEAFAVADRIVVMNQGAIEQVGDAMQVYREPTSLFVADFVGRINVLDAVATGPGEYRSGRLTLKANGHTYQAGSSVRLYLRPEDRVVEGSLEGEANRVRGQIAKVEFLGGHCLAELQVPELDGQPLAVFFSLNQVRELDIREGAALELALRPDRIRVFAA